MTVFFFSPTGVSERGEEEGERGGGHTTEDPPRRVSSCEVQSLARHGLEALVDSWAGRGDALGASEEGYGGGGRGSHGVSGGGCGGGVEERGGEREKERGL